MFIKFFTSSKSVIILSLMIIAAGSTAAFADVSSPQQPVKIAFMEDIMTTVVKQTVYGIGSQLLTKYAYPAAMPTTSTIPVYTPQTTTVTPIYTTTSPTTTTTTPIYSPTSTTTTTTPATETETLIPVS